MLKYWVQEGGRKKKREKNAENLRHERVSMEVSNFVASRLVYFTDLGDLPPTSTYIYIVIIIHLHPFTT